MTDLSVGSKLGYPIFAETLPDRALREGRYEVRFARCGEELEELQRLRFEVFNLELGEGLESSWATRLDADPFDPVCHHLLVVDTTHDEIVGTYRMQHSAMAAAHHGFYSQGEFELGGFPESVVADAVEVGRACVARSHRNTQVLFLLWKGLALYVANARKRYLFGCCSLTSQDPVEARAVHDWLERHGHGQPGLEILPQPGFAAYGPDAAVDRAFPVKIPQLFRIYLRHGAKICGPPAIDREFKTIDWLVLFDVLAMPEKMMRTFFG